MLGAVAKQAAGLVKQRELTEEAGKAEAIAQADELRRSLLSAVSHDLRTPLAAAKAAVSSLRSNDIDFSAEDTAELLATIEESIDQLTALVGNLLDSSRLAAGVLRPELRRVYLEETVQRALLGISKGVTGFRRQGIDRVKVDVGDAVAMADSGPARAGAGQPDRQRAAVRAGQPGAGHGGPGRRPRADRRRRRGAGHTARHRGAAVRAVPAARRPRQPASASASACRSPAASSRRWAAPSRPPTPRRRADRRNRPRRTAEGRRRHDPAEDQGAGHRRRTPDPAGAADQPVGARLRSTHRRHAVMRRCARRPITGPTSSCWTSGCPTCRVSRCSAGCVAGCTAPVIVLSARTDSSDKVEALDAGADDYVTKPFGMDEFLARLRAAVRRGAAASDTDEPVIETSVVHRRPGREEGDQERLEVHLTPTEWGMLEMLVRNRGKLVGREELLKEVWGPAYAKETHYLRVYLAQLRRKLEDDPSRPVHLLTEAGMGYRFHQ